MSEDAKDETKEEQNDIDSISCLKNNKMILIV
eukprot:CAMPEP_0114669378 /NCGR_PEP_ID=MMETSP0191-20121206/37969_1 /TAXON_ID=126664 /ORGANISM="Sorites sp." /LENGTH=31 /DNA_ID= /DNA_START= /DNA_END= /DNA_ORIENTATION=